MKKSLDSIQVERKTGSESFHENGSPLPFKLLDFWQWYASDLVSNATRGILAEYLVAKALGNVESPRLEWDAYDAVTKEGIKVEVKSASYIQSWKQKDYSKISFSTRSTHAWDYDQDYFASEKKRQADVYVFCILHHKDQETLNPLDLSQWTFYLVSTEKLNKEIGGQKSIGLRRLKEIGAKKTKFLNLESEIRKLAN
jgi:hypothetical protein